MFTKSLAGILLAFALLSCSKDELTRPVQTELVLVLANEGSSEESGLLEVSGGRLLIQELSFDGYRENGENYFFTREFPDSLEIDFSKDTSGRILSFEMPQGVYSRIDIKMKLPSGKEGTAGKSDIPRSALAGGVELWGTYENTKGDEIPFVFVYTSLDEFSYTANSATGGDEQVVVKDKGTYKATLAFNPLQWMELINARMLQSAKLTQLDGVPTIIISKTQNDHIYNLLASRIEKSATLNIE